MECDQLQTSNQRPNESVREKGKNKVLKQNHCNVVACILRPSNYFLSYNNVQDVKVIEIGTYGKSEMSAGRGRKRKNSELNGNA